MYLLLPQNFDRRHFERNMFPTGLPFPLTIAVYIMYPTILHTRTTDYNPCSSRPVDIYGLFSPGHAEKRMCNIKGRKKERNINYNTDDGRRKVVVYVYSIVQQFFFPSSASWLYT